MILIIGMSGDREGDFFCVIRFLSVRVNEVSGHLTYIQINVDPLSLFSGSPADASFKTGVIGLRFGSAGVVVVFVCLRVTVGFRTISEHTLTV